MLLDIVREFAGVIKAGKAPDMRLVSYGIQHQRSRKSFFIRVQVCVCFNNGTTHRSTVRRQVT